MTFASEERHVIRAAVMSGRAARAIDVPLDVTVLAAPPAALPPSAYVFAYFTGDSVEGEKVPSAERMMKGSRSPRVPSVDWRMGSASFNVFHCKAITPCNGRR
jgi:hypothetical protein